MEIDTYWIQHGGGDPAAWIEKVAGRIPCVHLKDMAMGADGQQLMAEVGEGNLNWAAIWGRAGRRGWSGISSSRIFASAIRLRVWGSV